MQQPTKLTVTNDQSLEEIIVFYPKSNSRYRALFDSVNDVAIGFKEDEIFHPVGGSAAIEQILSDKCPIPTGSEVFGFKLRHCYDNTYTFLN